MRGIKAKRFRRLVYGDDRKRLSERREYELSKSPGQHRHQMPLTIISDKQRFLYQALKGRRMAFANS